MINNLKSIGGRLGQIDMMELLKGLMLIDVDSRLPLRFNRKIKSPDGEEVTIQIKYHYRKCGY
ncbi:hypothetical protein Bca52824_022929 [Brassica carinata]|uniref:Uncharacterized protein n=1 Tax=Brassica carinata TaxID=52824 RepID=A0A8X7VHL6_BRACI|nr:hypothetical protein Bca52824_022929 [Brassica carinata]